MKLGLPASDVQLSEQFQYAQNFDLSLDQDDISSKSFKASDALQSFMKYHFKCSQYIACFKSRNARMPVANTVFMQHPVRLQKEVFDSLNYHPLPLLDNTKEHYQRFFLSLWARSFR